ncbi:MAG: DUF116 domain-containing protein [Deferrisomatales bacterium]|nr:DUF116 domain-containing protein [Deferrisomatales bacterium]
MTEGERAEGGGKRLFLGLLLVTGFLLGGVGLATWLVPRAYAAGGSWLAALLGAAFGAGALLIWAGIGILVFATLFERDLPGTRRVRGLLIRGFFPPLVGIARLLGIPKERVERSFIAVNNQLVLRSGRRSRPERMLILLPHCLQIDACDIRITGDIGNCRGCGRCPIAGLVELGERYGVQLSVATGGTIARRIIVEQRPEIIIAVACERDLTSGIQDAHPLPVYGILNERPEGPCFNTLVDLGEVERALARFVSQPAPRRAKAFDTAAGG